jgi:hypothetical protein
LLSVAAYQKAGLEKGRPTAPGLDGLADVIQASGQPLEFILAVPGRRYGDFTVLFSHFMPALAKAPRAK